MEKSWIQSTGGPLICCDEIARPYWRGLEGVSVKQKLSSDYLRACEESAYLGLLDSGPSQVLVLGDEAFPSTFLRTGGCVLVVRWIACSSEEDAAEVITNEILVKAGIFQQDPVEINVANRLYLFDSAIDQTIVSDDSISSIEIASGRYFVSTEMYQKRKKYQFLAHKFILAKDDFPPIERAS